MHDRHRKHVVNARTYRQSLALYLLFGLTGVGLVLPGTLLPTLARHWGWQDGRAGLLFFMFFVGTSAGAFCARGMLGRMLILAAFAIAIPTALLTSLRGLAVLGAVLLFGFGLGLVMTAVTLVRSRQVPGHRAAEFTRLNLVWAVGAACAPMVLLRSTAWLGLPTTLRSFAVIVFGCTLAAGLPLWNERAPASETWSTWHRVSRVPPLFAVCLPLATGIEAGVGGWLVTFALRENGVHRAVVTAGSALWVGLLLSRSLFSLQRFGLGHRRYAGAGFAGLLVFGLLMLLHGNTAAAVIAGAFCAGAGIGPLYPQLLAMLLNRNEPGQAGFLLAGAGSALLPLLIGQVSQQTHSLRAGLAVAVFGSVVLFVFLLRAGHAAKDHTWTGE